MPSDRARTTSRIRLGAGGLLLAGTALTAVSGAAQAAQPDLVPDLAPVLTAPNDANPTPAPTAPPVESSFDAFDSSQPLKQLRDFTPAGVPAAGLIEAVSEAPKKLTPSAGGSYGE